jgi:hypothetical protein
LIDNNSFYTSNRLKGLWILQGALRLSAHVLINDPSQIASQLVGRLPAEEDPFTRSFVDRLTKQVEQPWLRPTAATLVRPETRIISIWKPFSVAPISRLLVSDDGRFVAVVEKTKTSFWDIGTGTEINADEAARAFSDVDWPLWRKNLPSANFVDEDYHQFTWTAESPPGSVIAQCTIRRKGAGQYGGQYNVTYENSVSVRLTERCLPPVPMDTADSESSTPQSAHVRHHPIDCPSSSAEHWRSAMQGEQGKMAEDRAEEVDLDTYRFCAECDPKVHQKRDGGDKITVKDSKELSGEKSETKLPIHAKFQQPYYASRLEAGLIAPAVSKDGQSVVCGGLNGSVQIWDVESQAVRFADSIGPGTIVAIAPFLALDRVSVLTADGHLLIANISTHKPIYQSGYLPWNTSSVYVSDAGDRAVVSEKNGLFSVWDVHSGRLLYRDGVRGGCLFVVHRFSPDLSFSVVTAHGEDYYDGWILGAFDLVKGKKVFEFESHTPQDRFGELNLIHCRRRLFAHVFSWPRMLNESVDLLTGNPVWLDLNTGEILTKEPTRDTTVLPWATPNLCAENGMTLDIAEHGQSIRVTLPRPKGGTPLRFSPDSRVQAGGIALNGSCVVIACESAIHFLQVVDPKLGNDE